MNNDDRAEVPDRDISAAQDLALRYGCEFVDLRKFSLQPDVVKKIPVELMVRYDFVPLEPTRDGRLAIAIADPGQLMMIDEISLLLDQRVAVRVSSLELIRGILKTVVDEARKIDQNPAETMGTAPFDDSQEPGDPDQPVRSMIKPKPSPRSGGAMAVPEAEQ